MWLLSIVCATIFLTPNALAEKGIPKPFHRRDQVTMRILHNMARGSRVNHINMECVVSTNDYMVQYAQAEAEKCIRAVPNDTMFGVAFLRVPKGAAGIKEFTETATEYDDMFPENACTEDDRCHLYKQSAYPDTGLAVPPTAPTQCHSVCYLVFWHEAHELGCGRAICGNETLVVCAYSYRQEPSSVPYVRLLGQQCMQCSEYKPTCNSYNLCCNDESGYESIPAPAGEIEQCAQRPDMLKKLMRFWHQPTMRNFLLTDPTEIAMVDGQPGMVTYGPIGQVAIMPTAKCPQMLPIKRLYHHNLKHDYYEILSTVIKQRTHAQNGYKEIGDIGYAVKGENICGATVPVYAFRSPKGPIYLQRGEEATRLLKSGGAYNYSWAGIAFWIWE